MSKVMVILFISLAACSFYAFDLKDGPDKYIRTKAALGKKLFSEKLLSKDQSVSCASCHQPPFAFADTAAFSTGINGKLTKRNTPSVLNIQHRPYFFWDGRAASLQDQSLVPIQNPDEMGLPVWEAIERLKNDPGYIVLFKRVFGRIPDVNDLTAAFAAYEATLETVDSKFDDWANNKVSLTPSEERGRKLFIGPKAKCFDCHFAADFTGDEFKNIGLYNGTTLADAGLYNITKKESDKGKFKTPGLRNVAVTAPYMHNGMFKTLEAVIDHYNDPQSVVPDAINTDTAFKKPLGLTAREKKDLVAFLRTLTDKKYARR